MAPITSKEVTQMAREGLKAGVQRVILGQEGSCYKFFSHFETNGSEGPRA